LKTVFCKVQVGQFTYSVLRDVNPSIDQTPTYCNVISDKTKDGHEVFFSPRIQMKLGMEFIDITCSQGFSLIEKYSGNSIACVKPSTADKLIERGWGLETLSIGSFEECVAAENPVIEGFAKQCITIDGRHFIKEIFGY